MLHFKAIDPKKTLDLLITIQNNRQLDLVEHDYPWLDEPVTSNGLRLASHRDITAMELSAITNSGTRKDFVDIELLLNKFSLNDMLQFYKNRFLDGETFSVLKSLVYFNDAEEAPIPNMLVPFAWQAAKQQISSAVESVSAIK